MTIQNIGRDLRIQDGPGVWDMILSLFEGKPVYFKFEDVGRQFDLHPFVIAEIGMSFCGGNREQFRFHTLFPGRFPESRPFVTDGYFNLRTRKGNINVDPTPGACAQIPG